MSTAIIKLLSVNVDDQNHVGQTGDWYYLAKINDIAIKVNEEKNIKTIEEGFQFYLEAYEEDKIVDKGTLSEFYSYNKLQNKHLELTVAVTENRGRFAGNAAKVKFVFDIQ